MSNDQRLLSGKTVWITDELPEDVRERLIDITQKLGGRFIEIFDLLNCHFIITSPPYTSSPWFPTYSDHLATLEPDEPRPALRPYYWLFACLHRGKLVKPSEVPKEPVFSIDEVVAGKAIKQRRPMRIYVSINVLRDDEEEDAFTAKGNIISMIECNGGISSEKRVTADVLVVNLATSAGSKIKAEMKKGQFAVEREWVEERLGMKKRTEDDRDSFADEQVSDRVIRGKRTRQDFSQKDDEKIVRWLALNDPNATKWLSRVFYDDLMADPRHRSWSSRHTRESWRERVKKNKEYFRKRVVKLDELDLDEDLRTGTERERGGLSAIEDGDEEDRPSKKKRTLDRTAIDRTAQYAHQQSQLKKKAEAQATALHRAEVEKRRGRGEEEANAFGASSEDEEGQEERQVGQEDAIERARARAGARARSQSVGQLAIQQPNQQALGPSNGHVEVALRPSEPFPMTPPRPASQPAPPSVQVELDSEDEKDEDGMRRSMRNRSSQPFRVSLPRDASIEDYDKSRGGRTEMAQQFLAGLNRKIPGLERAMARRARASEPGIRLPRVVEERRAPRHSFGELSANALAAAEEYDEGEDEDGLIPGETVPVHLTGELRISSIQVSPRSSARRESTSRGHARISVASSTPERRAHAAGVASPLGRLRQGLALPGASSSIPMSHQPSVSSVVIDSAVIQPSSRMSVPTPASIPGTSRPHPRHRDTDLSLVVEARSETSEGALSALDPVADRQAEATRRSGNDPLREAERRGTANVLAKLASKFGIDPKAFPTIANKIMRENGGVLDLVKLSQALKELRDLKTVTEGR